MSLKITFHFHPNVVMGTQIDKSGTDVLIFMKIRCDVILCTCYIVSNWLRGFSPCKVTWLRTPFFLDNRDTLHTADHIFTDFIGRCGGLVVEHQTPEREVRGSILSRVAVLYP